MRYFLRVVVTLAALSLASVVLADPLDDARDAQRVGDGAVLDVLASAEATRDARLVAIRRARWLRMPELALAPLATLATGRDPALAPEAAFTAHVIATTLDPLTLEAHEVTLAELAPARAALSRLAADTTARGDVRALASSAARHLTALGVP